MNNLEHATSINEAYRIAKGDKPKRERTQPIQVQHTPEPTMPKSVTQQTYAWAKAVEVIITRDIGGGIGSFRGELAPIGFAHHADERDGQMQRAQSADHFKVSDSEISRQIRKCLIQEKGLVNGGQKIFPVRPRWRFSFLSGHQNKAKFR